jgi:uncharacterized membrane protein
MKEKNLDLERLVFFSDAIVAIAATILVFGLKIDIPPNKHITFADIGNEWPRFSSFVLSFFIIALFWKIHHEFFHHIKTVNNVLLWFNIIWLLFIVLLPFTSSLVSTHFFDIPAMVAYCFNIFFLTIFQNMIWDYASVRPDFLKDADLETIIFYRRACNVAMINALIALGIAFFWPLAAFIILLSRLPMILLTKNIYSRLKRYGG